MSNKIDLLGDGNAIRNGTLITVGDLVSDLHRELDAAEQRLEERAGKSVVGPETQSRERADLLQDFDNLVRGLQKPESHDQWNAHIEFIRRKLEQPPTPDPVLVQLEQEMRENDRWREIGEDIQRWADTLSGGRMNSRGRWVGSREHSHGRLDPKSCEQRGRPDETRDLRDVLRDADASRCLV